MSDFLSGDSKGLVLFVERRDESLETCFFTESSIFFYALFNPFGTRYNFRIGAKKRYTA